MEFISELPIIGGFLSSAISFVVVLGIVVFIHEYGHYIVGRWCGIHADVFSLGFGPRLGGWVDRRGTEWQVAALPLGGYVRFLGDADGASRADPKHLGSLDEADLARSFHAAPVWKRSLTVAAGPVANFVLSVVIFGALVTWQGVPTEAPIVGSVGDVPGMERSLRSGDELRSVNGQAVAEFQDIYAIANDLPEPAPLSATVLRDGAEIEVSVPYPLPPLVFGVEPLSPAAAAGLKSGDYIAAAAGQELVSFGGLRDVVLASGGQTIPLRVLRDGGEVMLEITPRERELVREDGSIETRVMIGVSGDALVYPMTETPAPWMAAWIGMKRVADVITMSLTGIKQIILGNLGADNLQGPLGIAQISGQSASQGLANFISLIAVISTAIGLLNLFPIPVLDGGHLIMFGYEAVAGRPPAERVMQVAMSIGLAMVLLLMVFATYNDLMRLALS